MKQGISVIDATKKLEYYCSYQDRCYKEVIQKLKSLGMYETAINYILDHLATNNFLNEERYAKSFTRGKHNIKGWGKRRITQELKFREISSFNIKIALKEIENDYVSNFYALATKKWDNLHESSLEVKKRKYVNYLTLKGYENNLIYQSLQDFV